MKLYRVVTLVLCLLFCSVLSAQLTPSPPDIEAKAHLLVDYHSGRELSSFRPDARMHPASLTKIMTVFVAFSELRAGRTKPDDMVDISNNARKMGGSRMFVEAGSRVRLEELLKGVVVQSGNDASVAIAEHISGTEAAFVKLMGRYAASLGMQRTRFANAHGLTAENHYTTARDLVTLSRALIARFPDYYRWHKIKEFLHNNIPQRNRNRLLWGDASVDGIKTGHTAAAGYCLTASAQRGDMRLISVVLGAKSPRARTRQSKTLLDYGFNNFETRLLYKAGAQITSVRVWQGATEQVSLGLGEQVILTFPRGRYSSLSAEVTVPPRLLAPVATGSQQGDMKIMLDGRVLVKRQLNALGSVALGGWWRQISDRVRLMLD
jgi:serine-type D-Ala-D-Ala carboxypeptidase (penicillin-binding protein 5/6)